MSNAKQATQAHREGRDFYISQEEVEQVLGSSIKIPYNVKISTKEFEDNEITVFAFGDFAKQYGEFLREAGINEMPIWMADEAGVNKQENSFVRQLFFNRLGGRSSLNGDCRILDCGDRLRGACEKASETGSWNSTVVYTQKQISRVLKRANLSGIENFLFENLR